MILSNSHLPLLITASEMAPIDALTTTPVLPPFAPEVLPFLSALSRQLMTDGGAREYPGAGGPGILAT